MNNQPIVKPDTEITADTNKSVWFSKTGFRIALFGVTYVPQQLFHQVLRRLRLPLPPPLL